jgi:addiction module HigA family antidote
MMHNPPHPGEILKEDYLEPLGLSVTDTCKGLGISRKGLSEILNGHTGISPKMAIRHAKAFDTTPELWLNLQTQYELWNAREEVSLEKIAVFRLPAQPALA